MTIANLLRSRVRLTSHARFCSGGGTGDCLVDHVNTQYVGTAENVSCERDGEKLTYDELFGENV